MRKHALLVGRFLPSRPLFCLRIRLSLSTPRIHLCGAMLSTDAPDAKRRGSFERWKRTNQLSPCPTPRQLGEPTTSTRAHKQVVQNSNNQKNVKEKPCYCKDKITKNGYRVKQHPRRVPFPRGSYHPENRK